MPRSLIAMRRSLEPLTLPNDHTLDVRHLDAIGIAMVRESRELATAGKGEEAAALITRLLKHIMPDATDDDLRWLSIQDQRNLLTYAAGNVELLEAELKNVESVGAAPTEPTPESTGVSTASPPPVSTQETSASATPPPKATKPGRRGAHASNSPRSNR